MALSDLWREVKLSLIPLPQLVGKNEWRLRLKPQAMLIQAVGLANRLK